MRGLQVPEEKVQGRLCPLSLFPNQQDTRVRSHSQGLRLQQHLKDAH